VLPTTIAGSLDPSMPAAHCTGAPLSLDDSELAPDELASGDDDSLLVSVSTVVVVLDESLVLACVGSTGLVDEDELAPFESGPVALTGSLHAAVSTMAAPTTQPKRRSMRPAAELIRAVYGDPSVRDRPTCLELAYRIADGVTSRP